MNKLIQHSLVGACLCTVISSHAFASDTVNVTLHNPNPQWLVSRICTTTHVADDDYCTIFKPASSENTISVSVNLGHERNTILVRTINNPGNASTISILKAPLVPNGHYTLILQGNGKISVQ